LREIEERASQKTQPLDTLLNELNELEARVGKIAVPLSYADELYALRDHIDLVRAKLTQA
jgi:hypothetical protein